ncbi:MAG: TraI domain-containing protein [Candidatus Accumulibacter sp.]|uniref:TraI domain-containing protein n=1 Tax=Candidatus Accumulibacter proximus TaxID=2954385 RepID=A0A935PZZ0_9PROT|nr:TraI domain-containing protein [Candidatus Accumulibacter proximus]
MLSFIRKAVRLDSQSQKPVGKPAENDAAQTAIDEEIPRYPPFMRGLPATDPHKLIETQRELIGQIREAGLASPDIFEQFYLESLRRFASYAHLLPASQTHHHRGQAGCFVMLPRSPCGRFNLGIEYYCLESRRPGDDVS